MTRRCCQHKAGWLWYFFDTAMDGYEVSIDDAKALLYCDGPVTDLRRMRHPCDGAVEDADLGEFGTGYGAHPLAPCRITTVDPLDPPPVGFSDLDVQALRVVLPGPWGEQITEPPSGIVPPGPLQKLTVGVWSALVRVNSLQLFGHPSLIQSGHLSRTGDGSE